MNHHYNTTNETQLTLQLMESKAERLEDIIYDFFKDHPFIMLTPPQVQEKLMLGNNPLTSIRRAISNLTKAAKLVKTNEKRLGIYGVSNYCWMLRS